MEYIPGKAVKSRGVDQLSPGYHTATRKPVFVQMLDAIVIIYYGKSNLTSLNYTLKEGKNPL